MSVRKNFIKFGEWNVLNNIFKREKARVCLGVLAVVPRAGIKKGFESWGLTGYAEPDGNLKNKLIEIFCLPPSSSISEPLESDLVIDVLISEFQLGAALLSDIPLFWRPKITLVSRLYNFKSGETKNIISFTEKMPWSEFARRVLTVQGILQLRPLFNNSDLEKLLYIASEKVMVKIKNSV